MRTLLVVADGAVIDATGQNVPHVVEYGCSICFHVVGNGAALFKAVACLDITLEPFFLGELFRTPRQFAHQFVHHGIGLRTFHCQTDAHEVLCLGMRLGEVEVVEQLVHTTVHSHVGAKVLEQAEAPVVLLVAILLVPKARHTPHGTTFAEEVEEDDVARCDGFEHFGSRIL